MAWVLDLDKSRYDLPASAWLVLIGIANRADEEGRDSFPSRERLARYADVSLDTVDRATKSLEAAGLIVEGDPALRDAIIERADRRPNVWDMVGVGIHTDPDGQLPLLERGRTDAGPQDAGPHGRPSRGRTGADNGAALVRPEPSVDTSVTRPGGRASAREGKPRKRDELFEALIEACGWDLDDLTPSARGRANRAAKELRQIGASPEGVRARAGVHRSKWPDMDVTPNSLATNYPSLGKSGPSESSACKHCGQDFKKRHDNRRCPNFPEYEGDA